MAMAALRKGGRAALFLLFLEPLGLGALSTSMMLRRNLPQSWRQPPQRMRSRVRLPMSWQDGDESMEVVRSMLEFHNDRWIGQATSFTVTDDVASGIVQKKVAPRYTSSVKLGMSPDRNEFFMMETWEWDDKISSREVPLIQSHVDVDSVDASYSLDMALPSLPAAITGTDKLLQFGIEHCIAVNDEERVRCFVLYGVDQSLARVLVCNENKAKVRASSTSTRDNLLALGSDVDRIVNKMSGQSTGPTADGNDVTSESVDTGEDGWEQLQKAMASSSATENQGNHLTRHAMSLLELTSGVWLGDCIIRDVPNVAASPFDKGTGFGPKGNRQSSPEQSGLANWELGVQKSAWRWIWDFGDVVRQRHDVGKAMGAAMSVETTKSLDGSVCVNESLSRRIPKDQRMVYIDWTGDLVGLMLGSISIQVPRFIPFNREATKKVKPFFTEFCVYQSALPSSHNLVEQGDSEPVLPEICCSKITRVYNYEGKLRQGCTSFYTLRRFSADD